MSRRRYIRYFIALCLIFAILVTGGCARRTGDAGTLTVAVSIPPQAEFVERIGGDRVHVLVMIPPGANPHTYEPTPSQLVELTEAVLYVKVGSGIEFELEWLDRIVSLNSEMLVVDASEGIELATARGTGADHVHGDTRNPAEESGTAHAQERTGIDPHIWVSPRNAMIMVENTFRGLAAVDPAHRDGYTARRDAYVQELKELDRSIERMFAQKTQRKFITYHPAWGYLARDYGLEQISIEVEGKEPTARGIEHLVTQAKRLGITAVFVSPQFNTKSAEVIAREIGGAVFPADPLAPNYIENIRAVAAAIAGAMK
ncbi:MAG TPA: zinc ABC transporter substrate-binding protein [Patescibacteria group bacterium]|nr:zinc ABC transporter substrate-binding protein [Patescibacteria group bacterium]